MRLEGLHHITAITGDAPRNLDFYTRVMGMRLIAKTVNQDDPSVYHLFYGDEHAQPGFDLTFFEYPRAIPGQAGTGMVHRVVWRLGSADALDFWAERLRGEGVAYQRPEGSLTFADPEGLTHELLVSEAPDEPLRAHHPEIPEPMALQGFEGVRAYSASPEMSALMLERLLEADKRGEGDFELRGERRGGWIRFDQAPGVGRQSAGTIHHIAWYTRDEDYDAWLERLERAGVPNSGPVDRHYFRSIYFREPGGILYELATPSPGFLVDGLSVDELGTKIILPPWYEDQRAAIEARLTPLPDPRADWPVEAR